MNQNRLSAFDFENLRAIAIVDTEAKLRGMLSAGYKNIHLVDKFILTAPITLSAIHNEVKFTGNRLFVTGASAFILSSCERVSFSNITFCANSALDDCNPIITGTSESCSLINCNLYSTDPIQGTHTHFMYLGNRYTNAYTGTLTSSTDANNLSI